MKADFASTVQKALDKIGRSNGTAPPKSQDPADEKLHMYYIDKIAESFFKKRAEQSLIECAEHLQSHTNVIEAAKKKKSKQEAVICQTENYTMSFSTNTPARRFSQEKLKIKLAKMGWPKAQIDELIEASMDTNEPAKSYKVIPNITSED